MIKLPNIYLTTLIKIGLGLVSQSRHTVTNGQVRLDSLNKEVRIYRDPWGVPHIYSENIHDLMIAQGYTHAQERLWQMEFNRRMVAGRLSEVLGAATVQLDRWLRTLTLRRVAEKETGLLTTKFMEYLECYAEGVNSFIRQNKLPIEFAILRYNPEPWVISDTLSWIKMMAWGLSVNWEMELLRAKLIETLGAEDASKLEPRHLSRWPYIIPPEIDYSKIGQSAIKSVHDSRSFVGPSAMSGLGSNNWVISGELTKTGMPLLASDMHLPLNTPAIWFENHLVCDQFNVTGVTFPGIPGIVAGHNGHVAWSHTNGFADVQDLYVENIKRSDDGRVQVEYNGAWEDAHLLREEIKIKNGNTALEEVIITRHGPIINNIFTSGLSEEPIALRWTALEPDTMIQGLFRMLRARNCEEFHKALENWTNPNQNVVYADTDGNIAYTYAGKIPIRKNGNGRLPVPGWIDGYEWADYASFEQLPHLLNPEIGYIVSANNRVFDENYPLKIELEPISGDRFQRIHELIKYGFDTLGKAIDINYIKQMQYDQLSPSAREIVNILNDLSEDTIPGDHELNEVFGWLKSWDGILSDDSKEAAIYQVFIRKLIKIVLEIKFSGTENDQPYDLVSHIMGKGPNSILAAKSLIGDFSLPWLTQILKDADDKWFDKGGGETKGNILIKALRAAIKDLDKLLGTNKVEWSWGQLHQLTFGHILGNDPRLKPFFNRGPYASGGDGSTVWASIANYHDLSNEIFVGPPYRFIVDLGNFRNSISMLVPGQSGIPTSKHYDDQITAWFTQDYHPMLYERQDVEDASTEILELLPKDISSSNRSDNTIIIS